MKKIIFVILVTFVSLQNNSNSQTSQLRSYHLDGDLYQASFIDTATVFAIGGNGIIMRSGDRGQHWKQLYSGVESNLFAVAFKDAKTGIIVGDKGVILRTDDGGTHWVKINVKFPGATFRSVSMAGDHVLICGNSGIALVSTDAGNTWQPIVNIFSNKNSLTVAHLFDNMEAVIAGDSGLVYRSDDGCKTWKKVNTIIPPTVAAKNISVLEKGAKLYFSGNAQSSYVVYSGDHFKNFVTSEIPKRFYKAHFVNDSTAYFTDETKLELLKTTDGGNSLDRINNFDSTLMALNMPQTALAFCDEDTGIVVGFRKTIYRTTDGGQSWKLLSYLNDGVSIAYANSNKSVFFLNDSVGWIGGWREKISRTLDGGATWLQQHDSDNIDYPVEISDLHFFNKNKGYALSNGRKYGFLKTEDGGATYPDGVEPNQGAVFTGGTKMDFLDTLNGYVISSTGLYSTNDGGKTWNSISFGSDSIIRITGLEAISKDNVFVTLMVMDSTDKNNFIYTHAEIRKTNDRGKSWVTAKPDRLSIMGQPYFFNQDTGLVSGSVSNPDYTYTNVIFRTTDGGENWFKVDSGRISQTVILKFDFFGDLGYGIGTALIKTTNQGVTWVEVPNTKNIVVSDVAVPSLRSVYLSGSNNYFLKGEVIDSITTVVEAQNILNNPVSDIWMKQAYPNPTSGNITVKIYYSLALQKSDVSLTVYSMTGERVADITDNFRQSTGNNPAHMQWNTQGLPAGMYIIEAKGGNAQMTIPVVIAR